MWLVILVSLREAPGAAGEAGDVSGQYVDGWALHSFDYVTDLVFLPPYKWKGSLW